MTRFRDVDLRRLNSATKYPSIPTYHPIARGILQPDPQIFFDGPALVTEKIDGTNARILCFPDGDYIIGSREEFLYARGDFIINPELGIVDVVKPIAEQVEASAIGGMHVLFGEVYGGKIGPAKQYTSDKTFGFRLFDVIRFPTDGDNSILEVLKNDPAKISTWRKNGGQRFMDEDYIHTVAKAFGIEVTPRLGEFDMPSGLEDTMGWLESRFENGSLATLDESAGGRPEGVVVRSKDRSRIAKLRFEDYRKTLRARK